MNIKKFMEDLSMKQWPMPRYEIAKLLGVHIDTLRTYIRDLNITPESYKEIEHDGKFRKHGLFSSEDVMKLWAHKNNKGKK